MKKVVRLMKRVVQVMEKVVQVMERVVRITAPYFYYVKVISKTDLPSIYR